MDKRNIEPLLILIIPGLFLIFFTSGFLHDFAGKQKIFPQAATVAQVFPRPASSAETRTDSLRALLNDTDSVLNMYTGMEAFYEAVHQISADHTQLHIAYFGDSMIEGDLVTQPLRRLMQHKFGGIGIGFIPVTTPLPGFRTTVHQSFNDGWDVYSFVHPRNSDSVSLGISGYVYISEKGAVAKFEAPAAYGPYHTAEILYGGKNRITLEVITDTVSKLLSLVPSEPVSVYTIKRDTAFSVFKINVTSQEHGVFYGVNFEYGPGVYVDNYAFRGNSGLPLNALPAGIISGFNATLRNKLLIIHYGLNVFTPGVEDYHWYETAMVNVIRHIKKSSPGISILMISMPDRGALIDGEYHTPAGLPEFIGLQQRVASSEHIAFFNLYSAMGGANSMKKWVEGQPKLAGDDYTHPNSFGAAKIASLIYDYLLKGFYLYEEKSDTVYTSNNPAPAI